MPDDEIEKENAESPESKPGISYHLLHNLLPILLLQPDVETTKKNFFTLLDNEDAAPLKNVFLGFCKTAAEMAHERKYDFANEADNKALAETPGFLLPYFSLLQYSIVELKNKARIYIWNFKKPLAIPDPHYIAVVLFSEKRDEGAPMVRYITLEASYFGSMRCEWTNKGLQNENHANYGDCENDKDIFLDRVLDILKETRESIESATDCSLIEDRHSDN